MPKAADKNKLKKQAHPQKSHRARLARRLLMIQIVA